MQRIFLFLCSLFVHISTMHPLAAKDPKANEEAKSDIRILKLLPNLVYPLAIDPYIPADFVARSQNGTLDPSTWIYWGREEDLKDFFNDPDSLRGAILGVKLSVNTAQRGPDSFGGEESLEKLKETDPEYFTCLRTKWGNYPVLAAKYKMSIEPIRAQLPTHSALAKMERITATTAWVGLNDPEAGWTLLFTLVYPHRNGDPNEEACQLWENFITKTTQLKGQDYYKACGQDLQDGYTLVDFGGAKLKILAEKRKSDGRLQVVVLPQGSKIKFQYIDMVEGAMGDPSWQYGRPMVKVHGRIMVNCSDMVFINHYTTSVFLKTVKNFYRDNYGKSIGIFQKAANKKTEAPAQPNCLLKVEK